MNRQMYNMGGPSLQAGAPDITLTGDMRPTYSAMRKQRLAYGGIAGADGRKNYGIGSFFQEKIMDPIKENPVISGLVGAGLLNQFGLPDFLPDVGVFDDDFGQNFLGDLLGKVIPGDTEFNTVIGDNIPFKDIIGNNNSNTSFSKESSGGITIGGAQEDDGSFLPDIYKGITDAAKNQIYSTLGLQQPIDTSGMTPQGRDALVLAERLKQQNKSDFIKAMGIGTAAGAYADSQPKDTLPTDTTGINFQTAQQVLNDPNQRFKPPVEATQLAAEGGRIGYNGGGVTSYKNLLEKKGYKDMMQGMNDDEIRSLYDSVMGTFSLRRANGGRIGYANGTPDPVIPENFLNDVDKIIESYMKSEEGRQELMDKANEGISMPEIIEQMKQELMMNQASSQANMPMQQPNRMMAAEGGLMNLGGMEKDYREEGGFVPIG